MNTIRSHTANLSLNRTKFRQVLECASPPAFAARHSAASARRRLALFQLRRANLKRQRTAAVQDAVAPNAPFVIPHSAKLSALLSDGVPLSGSAILKSRRLPQSRIHAVEQERTEGTEIWEPVEAVACCDAQISRKRDSAQRIRRGGKSGFSLSFLRCLLCTIEYLRLSPVAGTFLSAVVITGSLLILCPTSAHAQGGVPLWTNRYAGSPAGYSTPAHIAVDSSGNVFVTVSLYSRRDLTAGDYVTFGYSSAGVPLWTNIYNGPGNDRDEPSAITVDSSGNVFVTGISARSALDFDYATIKYSSAGVPLWTNRYGGPAHEGDVAQAIAVDSSGNVFVTGQSNSSRDSDYGTVAYSNSGVPLWTNRYNGPANANDGATAIAVDSNGSVFVTGYSLSGSSLDTADYVTIAYSNAGVPLWTNRYEEGSNLAFSNGDYATAIAVDSSGNVFVTGLSTDDPNQDYVTIKYSSSVPPVVHLDFQLLDNQLVLSWTNAGFNLQSAPAVTGTFTNLPAATSPYTHALTTPQLFFRLALPPP